MQNHHLKDPPGVALEKCRSGVCSDVTSSSEVRSCVGCTSGSCRARWRCLWCTGECRTDFSYIVIFVHRSDLIIIITTILSARVLDLHSALVLHVHHGSVDYTQRGDVFSLHLISLTHLIFTITRPIWSNILVILTVWFTDSGLPVSFSFIQCCVS